MLTRRTFLKSASLAALGSQVHSKSFARGVPKNILVLGGTSFLGPAIVERALEAGHRVTIFNRGKTNPWLFPQLEKLHGDRELASGGGLSALSGRRHWDAVIDVWPSEPKVVIPAAQLLADRTDFYSFVSSVGAYSTVSSPNTDETQLLRLDEPGYGGDKARCEKQLADLFGRERLGIVRPCAISGPRDPSLSFHYWLSHLSRRQRIVAPGNGNDPIELVDVRDVANWIVANVEAHRSGPYNVCGQSIPFKTFLTECREAIQGHAQMVWVGRTFLEAKGIRSNGNMPFWNPSDSAFEEVASNKARHAGWSTRPLGDTARDAWRSYADRVDPALQYPQHQWSYEWGISDERQAQILKDWDSRHNQKS